MQQPYPPRLQINPPHLPVQGAKLGSPGGIMFTSPAAYSAHPFGPGALLSPEGPAQHPFVPPPYPGGLHSALQMGRQVSLSSTGSPLTPIPQATLASPFFPSSAPPARSPSISYSAPPAPHAPPRRTTLHAATPSFHPSSSARPFLPAASSAPSRPRGHAKRESVSTAIFRPGDDPLRSPTLARAGSVSPALPFRRDEPKRKKVIVRVPREMETDEETGEVDAATRPKSAIQRVPLAAEEREAVEALLEKASAVVDVAGRDQHPDEVKFADLPPDVDVYLPGRAAWEEVWETFEQEMKAQHGYCDIRRPTFLPPVKPSASPLSFDNLFPRRAGHGRTASLFASPSASLPPRLQSVLDSVRRVGTSHGPSLSLSFPSSLGALRGSPSLTAPALSPGPSPSPSRLTPLAKSFVPSSALDAAAATPLPRSPLASPEQPQHSLDEPPSAAQKWRPTLQELGRGFGIEEHNEGEAGALELDEAGGAPAPANGAALPDTSHGHFVPAMPVEVDQEPAPSAEVAAVVKTAAAIAVQDVGSNGEAMGGGHRSSPPSRRTSGVSTKTDHTGVASQSDASRSWSDASDDAALGEPTDEPTGMLASERAPEESPALSHELVRALSDLGPLEAQEVLVALPALPAITVNAEPGVDEVSDDSQYGDAELTEDDYSNPSDEEAARERAIVRARSSRALRHEALLQQHATSDDDDMPLARLALKPPADDLFEAPSDIDRTDIKDSPSKRGDHRVTRNFEFPARSPSTSPVKLRRAAHVALPDSSPESHAARPSLPPLDLFISPRTSLDFGDATLPSTSSPSFVCRPSESYSPDALGFGAFGQPGSLAASPSLPPETPPIALTTTLNPGAGEFRAQTAAAISSALKPTAVEFTPSLARSLPSSLGHIQHSAFDFLPLSDAPSLSCNAEASAQPPPRHGSGSHGPLPPLPLTTIAPHTTAIQRQNIEGDLWLPAIGSAEIRRVISAPVLAHPQPRRPLPEPPAAMQGGVELESDDEVEILRDGLDERDAAEESEPGNRSFISVDDPLPDQYAPARPVVGRRADAAELREPSYSLRIQDAREHNFRPTASNGVGGPRPPLPPFATDERVDQVSPARMGDPRARQESIDIALPSSLRVKSKAISLSAPRQKLMDVFDETYGVPDSPAADTPGSRTSASSIVDNEDDDDLPLRVLEGLITAHFFNLKADLLASYDQNKPDLDSLFEKLDARIEQVRAAQTLGPTGESRTVELMLEKAHKRMEQIVASALERDGAANASANGRQRRPTLLDPHRPVSAPPLRPSTPGLIDVGGPALAYSSFIEELQRTVQPLVRAPLEPDALAARLASALQPQLAELLTVAPPSTSSSQVTIVDSLALEKVNSLLEPALAQLSALDGLADSIAGAVATRMGGNSPNGGNDDQLVRAEAGLAPSAPLDSVRSTLQALKAGQDQLVDALKKAQDEQASLKSALGQHRHDFTSRQDFAFTKLEEFLKTRLGSLTSSNSSATDSAKIADLEAQLAKAHGDRDKARSEAAAAQHLLEAERVRHETEVREVRDQVAQLVETGKTVEGKTHEAREALAASKGEISGLGKRLAAQDARLDALQRAKTVQQQSLALATKRNADNIAALAAARARIAELEAASSTADDKLNSLEEENGAYRQKFVSLQQGLETMKATVKGELDEAAARIASLVAERDRLAEENDRLVRAAYDDAPPTPRQTQIPHIYPSPLSPPVVGNGTRLLPQRTGDSDGSDGTVAHTDFSPTPSVSGQSVFKNDEDGWWSAVVE